MTKSNSSALLQKQGLCEVLETIAFWSNAMNWRGGGYHKHCRWCGEPYTAYKPHDRDGFDKPACKQAHHRAYKKYVTTKQISAASSKDHTVTPAASTTPRRDGRKKQKK